MKTKAKLKIIIPIAVLLAAIIAAAVFLKATELSRAIKGMDISDKASVTRVLKKAHSKPDILCDIAGRYLSESDPTGAGILLHTLQNVDCDNERAKTMLKDYYTKVGADPIFINQVDEAYYVETRFEPATEYDGLVYGGMEGIFCSNFDGYVRYKLSGARAKNMFACESGVYFLDSADENVKLLSADGTKSTTVLENVSEFVFFDGKLYSIDKNEKINAPSPVSLKEGEFGANLRVVGECVMCDIFNESYQLIDTITLN